ncbi:MAG TPA: DUF998 domain-containing protein [Propionibacteriaceae bacterium]|nr:DUF998 domain-containing protein [Propionibacteriaceae bacterium]
MSRAAEDDRLRLWGWVGLLAQVIFVASWLIAGLWQGQSYSALADTISDMYAITAPHGWVLVITTTLAGAGTIAFAWLGLRVALRRGTSGRGWLATTVAILLSLSILGLGDLLTPMEREACRLADPGCSPVDQVGNLGGKMDAVLSTAGLLILVATGFVLAAAMRRSPAWSSWAWPTRWATIAIIVLLVVAGAELAGLGGLFQRLLAAAAAGGVAALAVHAIRIAGLPTATNG